MALKKENTMGLSSLFTPDTIDLAKPTLKKSLNNKVVLITGAAGSIGRALAKYIANYKCKKLILIDQAESDLYNLQQILSVKKGIAIKVIVADIRNKNSINTIFKTYKPHIVFHAAAYKHVPLMEDNPQEAVKVNILGTKIVADNAQKYLTEKFVLISTDKAVNPTSVMGTTKRVAEMYMQCLNQENKTQFVSLRFGNVVASNGSVMPLFKSQIENGGPLTLTHKEMTRYFISIPKACQLILETAAMSNSGALFVFDMGKPIKIYNLAKKMIRLSGLRFPEDIAIKITGLRPGEKLHEELWATTEKKLKTSHNEIKIAQQSPIDCETLKKNVMGLSAIKNDNPMALVALLKEIVPEYMSNNSVFEALDKKEAGEVVVS